MPKLRAALAPPCHIWRAEHRGSRAGTARSQQDPAASAAASDPGLTCARLAPALHTHACVDPQPQSVRLMPRKQAQGLICFMVGGVEVGWLVVSRNT